MGFLLLPPMVSAFITGVVLCLCAGVYGKLSRKIPFVAAREQIEKYNSIEYCEICNKNGVIIGFIDFVIGIIVIFVIGIITNQMFASLMIGFFKDANIDFLKDTIEKVAQLGEYSVWYITIGVFSTFYVSMRRNHFLKRRLNVKKLFKWIFKSNPKTWTAVVSIIGAIVLPLLQYLGTLDWGMATPIVAGALGMIGTFITAHLGLETNDEADERKSEEAEILAKEKAEKEYLIKAEEQLKAQQEAQIQALANKLKSQDEKNPYIVEHNGPRLG